MQTNSEPAKTKSRAHLKLIRTPTVLLVEDDAEMAAFLVEAIENYCGYRVLRATNGRQADWLLRSDHIDVILTDIVMPECDGLELIRIKNASHPHVPLIAMTGGGRLLGDMDLVETARMLGANAALPKPLDIPRLLKLMTDMVPQTAQ